MEHITITDEEGVKAFIEAQDEARQQACTTFIASRAALRVAPLAIQFFEFNTTAIGHVLTALVTWHPLVVTTVAAIMPTDEIKFAAAAFATAANTPAANDAKTPAANDDITHVGRVARAAVAPFAAVHSNVLAAVTYAADATATADILAEVSRDARPCGSCGWDVGH